MATHPRTPEDFFEGSPEGFSVFAAIADAVSSIGEIEVRVTQSQIAFRGDRRGFAYVWRPDRYLKTDVPAVLSIALARQLDSPKFKEVVHPSSKVWMHHIEMSGPHQVDDEVTSWLHEAHEAAG